jgi:peptide/nickel transport system permease protein
MQTENIQKSFGSFLQKRTSSLNSIARRVALSALTLLLLSIVVFAAGQILPGDVGRSILGPLADPRAVAALNHQLGTDQPPLLMYLRWVGGLLQGDMGQSYAYRSPVAPFIGHALAKSLALAAVTSLIVIPLSVGAGIIAALKLGRWQDRLITLGGLSLTVVPEFVSGILLILIFGVWLRWLPISANTRPGTGAIQQVRHLILPALPLVLILFGYISRIARAGMIEALEADYTRTATLKGLPRHTVIVRHVLRNALLPTITVIATQTSYLIGGLVVVETLFRYQGIGSLILTAARGKDYPMLEAGILTVGAAFIISAIVADMLTALLDPRSQASRR